MSGHTQGLLRAAGESPSFDAITSEDGTPIFDYTTDDDGLHFVQEDARRLVACWNACDGLDTQGLEDIVANGDNIKARQERDATRVLVLTHQRDQLSTALGTSTANYATLAEKLAQAESQRDALLKAARRAVVTLAHAAEDNPIYQDDYDLLSDAISTTTRTPS